MVWDLEVRIRSSFQLAERHYLVLISSFGHLTLVVT
jgi:hypothetical protein